MASRVAVFSSVGRGRKGRRDQRKKRGRRANRELPPFASDEKGRTRSLNENNVGSSLGEGESDVGSDTTSSTAGSTKEARTRAEAGRKREGRTKRKVSSPISDLVR